MSDALENIPLSVRSRVIWALQTVREWNKAIENCRKAELLSYAPGQHEWYWRYDPMYAEVRENLRQARMRLRDFEALAPNHGIDVQAVYDRLGGYEAPMPERAEVALFRPKPQEVVS
jgi:hypothetical protein